MPRPRSCPACGEPMKHLQRAGEHLDECVACGGGWFDAGELRAYAHAKVVGNLKEGLLRRYFQGFGGEVQVCPACGAAGLHTGETEGHAISGCEACGGFFLPAETLDDLDGLSAIRRKEGLFRSAGKPGLVRLGEAAMEIIRDLRTG